VDGGPICPLSRIDLSETRICRFLSAQNSAPAKFCPNRHGQGGKEQVSDNGGTLPHWPRNGRELVYQSGDQKHFRFERLNRSMEFKLLGSSNVPLAEIGLGTWRYTGGIEPLRAGVERGQCFLDTAENYGTEELAGEVLRGRRATVFLATKVAPRNFRRADLIRAADNSLKRLGTDYIDLYQLHWPNLKVPIEESMAAMEELVDAGKIRFIGVSNFSVRYLKKAQAALSKYKIVSNQVRYSLIDRSVERDLLGYCRRSAITIIAFSPLGLNFSNLMNADPEGVLTQVARNCGKTEAQVALNWLIAKDNVVAIPKASSVPHALEDCGASGWRLSPDQYGLLERKIRFESHGPLYEGLRICKRYAMQSLGRGLA
jgi:diketogulonate reductase-like aldo/keto reductase